MPSISYKSSRASYCVCKDAGYIDFHSFISFTPRQGHGTVLLSAVKKLAKKLGMPVQLYCSPYGPDRTSPEETLSFYEKLGFTPKCFYGRERYKLIYNPKGLKS